jgi:hypothetical protein
VRLQGAGVVRGRKENVLEDRRRSQLISRAIGGTVRESGVSEEGWDSVGKAPLEHRWAGKLSREC